jgi:hypothetical protein
MAKVKSDTLHVKGIDVGIYTEDYRNEYISLTDIARYRNSDDPRFAIQNWMRNRNTIEFLRLWESLHNPSFNRVQFDTFIYCTLGRVNIRLSLQSCKGGRSVF